MADPTQFDLTEGAAEALAGTVHSKSGIKHIPDAVDRNSNPSLLAQLKNLERKIMDLLAGANRGMVIWSGSGLTVGAYALDYELGAVAKSFPGDATFGLGLPINDTSFVFLDTAATLKSSISGWPAGDHIKLAKVTTDATQITDIQDMRFANFQVGTISNWWSIPPTSLVNFNNQDVDNIKRLGLTDPVTQALDINGFLNLQSLPSLVKVDTWNMIASQFINSFEPFTSGLAGRVWLLTGTDPARVVTLDKTATNFITNQGNFVFDGPGKSIALMETPSGMVEIFRSSGGLSSFDQNVNANEFNLFDLAMVALNEVDVTLQNNAIQITNRSNHAVSNEEAASTDDLVSIDSGINKVGLIITIRHSPDTGTTIVKHNAGNILLANDVDYALVGDRMRLVLMWAGTVWVEIARSHRSIADLVDTAEAIPYTIEIFESGALTTGVKKYKRHVTEGFTIKDVHAYVGTAPSGGTCIVDVLVNGSSIYANQSEMVNIADAATFDSSVVKNHVVVAGDAIEFEIEAANAAADLTLVINGFIAPKTAPV